jgi:hypothetical protein
MRRAAGREATGSASASRTLSIATFRTNTTRSVTNALTAASISASMLIGPTPCSHDSGVLVNGSRTTPAQPRTTTALKLERTSGDLWQDADMSPAAAIERYLRTGEHDPLFRGWSGRVVDRARRGDDDMKRALIEEVTRRAVGRRRPAQMPALDLTAFTRAKVEAMVRGLFPEPEHEPVLRLLERSVVFLTPDRVASILLDCRWLGTAWDVANLYLGSLDAELLGPDAPRIVGLSAETTCFVSLSYFLRRSRE